MKMDKEKVEQENEFNSIKVGEIILQSKERSVEDLSKEVKKLLKSKDIRNYLQICDKKKLTGNYFG